MDYNFPVTRTTHPKPRPADESKLGFAKYFTDHMFVMDWDEGQGWHDGRVVPHAPIEIEPASCVLHYAQMMFEGMKAYRTPDGSIQLFRPDMNIARIARTNERMCIPDLPGDLFLAAVKAVIWEDRDWIPSSPGTALYIRPFIFGDEVSFSVLPAKHYRFMIILTPTGSYYAANDGGLATTRIYVQDNYIRAARGGTGYAKVGGNYGGGMRASLDAMKYNCKDVLWLDAAENKYVEEIGTSNAFFRINDEVITAPLDSGTILPGITRNSVRHPAGDLRLRHRRRHLPDRLPELQGHRLQGGGREGRPRGPEALRHDLRYADRQGRGRHGLDLQAVLIAGPIRKESHRRSAGGFLSYSSLVLSARG